jgi:hypothetical protein
VPPPVRVEEEPAPMIVPIMSIERRVPAHPVGGRIVAVVAAFLIVPVASPAQQPSTSRDELIRKWDLDRDGKISDGEAEVARSRMRRARLNAELGGADPLSTRPRAGGEASSGAEAAARPELGSSPATRPLDEDGGLILVPGTGDRGGRPLGLPDEPAPTPRREREPLPGNRAPTASPPIPQASARSGLPAPAAATPSRPGAGLLPGRDAPPIGRDERAPGTGRELTSRARVLPGGPPPVDALRRQPVPSRPGVIAGGAAADGTRSSPPAVRPGYGAPVPNDLNAGRLPAGLPPSRGTASGPAAPMSRMGPGMGPGMGAGSVPGLRPEGQATPARRPLSGPRSTVSSPPPLPPPPRPGGLSPTPRSTAAPRVSRPAAENVYGR